jgi:exodeoxyribonuclease VII large subunit
MIEKIRFWKERLVRYAESRALGQPLARLREEAQRLDDLTHRLAQGLRRMEERTAERIRAVSGKLGALNPLGVLERGYSICRGAPGGRAITSSTDLAPGGPLFVRFRRGAVEARVEKIEPPEEGEES